MKNCSRTTRLYLNAQTHWDTRASRLVNFPLIQLMPITGIYPLPVGFIKNDRGWSIIMQFDKPLVNAEMYEWILALRQYAFVRVKTVVRVPKRPCREKNSTV